MRQSPQIDIVPVLLCNREVWQSSDMTYPAVNDPNITSGFTLNVLFHSRPSCVPSSSSGLRRSRARRPWRVTICTSAFIATRVQVKIPGYQTVLFNFSGKKSQLCRLGFRTS